MPPPAAVTVAVLGAAGTIAPAIIRDLAQSDEVASMLLLDLDQGRAAAVASAHGAGKARAAAADARDSAALAAALDGIEILINAASYRINLDAMRACLAAGCHYLDLGGLYWMTGRQLELDEDFRRAGLLALLGIGSSPGKTNVMAARAVRELGGVVDSIDVAAAGRDPRASGGFSPPYAVRTLIDELTLAPVVLRGGSPVEIHALHPGGTLDYGPPIGQVETIHTLHSELATFGESFGCREVSFRLSLAPALLSRLRELASATAQVVERARREAVSPSAETVSVHMIIARGGERTVLVRAVSRPHFGLGGSVVSTAAPAAAAVRLLARGELTATGALPPERCIEPELLFAELESRGCSFEVLDGG
ncbi:MAG TPA: saccharopine dehydrogenase NADP-binding domain-containing protein [Solirubrobacteraceae bacterium]